MKAEKKPFWEVKSLEQMTPVEWEALCDGCALCCLHKFEDKESSEVYYTAVSCKLLNRESCRCRSYKNRFRLIEDCIEIRPKNFDKMHMLPKSCAYRRLSEGNILEDWHYLLSGDRESVHEAGISARGRTIPEDNVHPDDITDFVLFKIE